MKLVCYVRASTDKQAASPHTQEHHIREYCLKHDHDMLRVYHESVISRKTEIERRTVLPLLVAEIRDRKRDFDGIIVWRTDRLFGNQAEFHRLLSILDKHKCEIISVMDPVRRNNAAERFMTNVMADAAAYERELIAERVYAHHVSEFLKGRWPGGPQPMGITWVPVPKPGAGYFVANDRAPDVEVVFRTYLEANGSAKEAVRRLNDINLPSPRGGLWSGTALLCMLRNPVYRQKMTYSGHTIDAAHMVPLITPQDLVAQVDTLLLISKRNTFHPRSIASKRAYSGMLQCSLCGALMTSSGRETEKRSYKNWQCSNRRAFRICDGHQLANHYIDTLVGHAIAAVAKTIQRDIARRLKQQGSPALPKDTATRQSTRDRLEAERKKTMDLFVKGYIAVEELDKRVADIERRLGLVTDHQTGRGVLPTQVVEALSTIAQDWPLVPDSEKRGLLLQLGATMTMNTSGDLPLWLELRTSVLASPIRVQGIPHLRKEMEIV